MKNTNSPSPSVSPHLRIAALQCDFEGGLEETMRVPGLWHDFGFDTEQLFHTHAENYSAVFLYEQHADKLRAYLAECRQQGIAVILYMNCHILLDSQEDHRDEWAQSRADGSWHRPYGTYYGCCSNSSWKSFFFDAIAQLKSFDIAGLFFDGPSVLDCYCPRCRQLFRESYGCAMEDAAPELLADFSIETRLRFMEQTYQQVKKTNANWRAYFNSNLLGSNLGVKRMQRQLACNDLLGTEGGFLFYGPPKNSAIWHCGLSARMVESLAGDKPRVIFMAGDHKPWSWYLHTPADSRTLYAAILANGASVWYGIHCNTASLNGRTGHAVRDMVQFEQKHEALYRYTESVNDLAFFYSFATAQCYTTSGMESDFYENTGGKTEGCIGNYSKAVEGAYGALFRSGLPCDLVTELSLNRLADYATVFAPSLACMTDETAAALRNYVANGGVLIADSETSLYDGDGKKQPDFLLADLFGASFRGYQHYQTHDYVRFTPETDPFAGEGVPYLPAPTVGIQLEKHAGAIELAAFCPPLSGRYSGCPQPPDAPFILQHSFGKGQVWYLAGTWFELYADYGIVHIRRWLEQLIRAQTSPEVSFLNLPEAVEATVRRSLPSGDLLVHLVNFTGSMTRPIEQVVPLRQVRLQIRTTPVRVASLTTGKELSVSATGEVIIPELRDFEVLRLTPATL